MSRSGSARGRPVPAPRSLAVRLAVPLAAAALVASAAVGAVVGWTRPQPVSTTAQSGAFVTWLEAAVSDTVAQVSAAVADHELRHRGVDVLGANASLSGVPFESARLRLAHSSSPTPADVRAGVFRAQVLFHYQLAVDDVRVGRRAHAVFRLIDGRWHLVRVSPSGLDLWDHEAVQSVRRGKVLVLGHDGDARLAGLGVTAAAARDDVDEFWTARWPGTAVVVLPSSPDLLNPLLGVQSSGADQVAVTRWESGRDGPVIRVLVNPSYYDQMSPLARQIILRHEITHVAQDALPRGGVPTWLTEGLAEYVGYHGSGVPPAVVGGELFAEVRAHGAPRDLPGDAEFGFDRSQAERRVAYESGWSFHQMLAERFGDDTLVPFYVAVAKSPGSTEHRLDRAAGRVFGRSFDQLLDAWRSWLEEGA